MTYSSVSCPFLSGELTIGDYIQQDLPFDAGNVHYDFILRVRGSRKQHTATQLPRLAAPLLAVQLDGKHVGKIAFQPRISDLSKLAAGDHGPRVTAYGNKEHAFGAVHLPDELTKWYGLDAFRTSGSWRSYEYTIREMGLSAAVRVMTVDDRGSLKGYLRVAGEGVGTL